MIAVSSRADQTSPPTSLETAASLLPGLSPDEREHLLHSALAVGVAIYPRELTALAVFLAELSLWSTRINLVSAPGGRAELIERHIADSLAAAPLLAALGPRMAIADLGSGAGLPGVPLAIVLRPARMVLVEARQKRSSFLRAVVRALRQSTPGLELEVANERIEHFANRSANAFDAVVSRAALHLSTLLHVGGTLLRPGGVLIAYRRPEEQVLAPPAEESSGWQSLQPVDYRLPSPSGVGRLVSWRRLPS